MKGTARRLRHPGLLLVVVLALAVNAGSLKNGFVHDDHWQVLGNPWLLERGGVGEIFSHDVWGFAPAVAGSNWYRPLMHVQNLLVHELAGFSAWAYHLPNLLLHAAASALLLLVVAKAMAEGGTRDPWRLRFVPAAAAALFAVHPVHVEAVAWVAGVPDVAMSALFFGSLLLYQHLPAPSVAPGRVSPLSLATFALALLWKEVAIVFPAALVAYDALVRREAPRRLASLARRRYAPYVAVAVAYLGLRFAVLGGLAPRQDAVGEGAAEWAHGFVQAAAWYAGRAVVPWGYSFFTPLQLRGPGAVAASLAAAALLAGVLCVWAMSARRSRVLAFFGVLALLAIAPMFHDFAMMISVADRSLYLPSAAVCVWLASAAAAAAGARPRLARGTAVALTAGVVALYGAATIARTPVFRSDLALWSASAAREPKSTLARALLGSELVSRGRFEEGLRECRAAETLGFREPWIHRVIGLASMQLQRYDEAAVALGKAVGADPRDAAAHVLLGELFLMRGDWRAAVPHFDEAVRLEPLDARARYGLGAAFEEGGNLEAALREYEASGRLAPETPDWRAAAGRVRGLLAGGGR